MSECQFIYIHISESPGWNEKLFYRNVKYHLKASRMDMEIAVFLGLYNSVLHNEISVLKMAMLNLIWLVRSLKGWDTIWSVVFLLTSSVATVAICCLELKAVWISYRQVPSLPLSLSLEREIIGNWITTKLLLGIIKCIHW